MPLTPCPGPCNNRWRRAEALYKEALRVHAEAMAGRAGQEKPGPEPQPPQAPQARPWGGEPVWCGRCAAVLHAQLAELDDLAAMLLAVPDLRPGADRAGKVSGTRGARSPSPFADDADELTRWARDWEAVARGGEAAARRGWLASDRTVVLAGLTATWFTRLIVHEDVGADFGDEIRRWHRELRGKARAGQEARPMGRPCPRCRRWTLWSVDGEDYIKCVNVDCQRLLTREEYRDLGDGTIISTRKNV